MQAMVKSRRSTRRGASTMTFKGSAGKNFHQGSAQEPSSVFCLNNLVTSMKKKVRQAITVKIQLLSSLKSTNNLIAISESITRG